MNKTVKARLTLAILAALALPAGLAHAGEGNGEPFGLSVDLATTRVGPTVGFYAYRTPTTPAVSGLAFGEVAKTDGSQGEPEPLNALPSAPETGGIWASRSAPHRS